MDNKVTFPLAWYLLLERISDKYGAERAYKLFKFIYTDVLLHSETSYLEYDLILESVLNGEEEDNV
jgi:hypothetical protein